MYSTNNAEKGSIVERWIRTIKPQLWKCFLTNGTANPPLLPDSIKDLIVGSSNLGKRMRGILAKKLKNSHLFICSFVFEYFRKFYLVFWPKKLRSFHLLICSFVFEYFEKFMRGILAKKLRSSHLRFWHCPWYVEIWVSHFWWIYAMYFGQKIKFSFVHWSL